MIASYALGGFMRLDLASPFPKHSRFFSRVVRVIRKGILKFVAAALSVILLAETAFAYKPQANVWAERGAHRVQLASANLPFTPISPATQLHRLFSTLRASSLPRSDAGRPALPLPAEFLANVNIRRTAGRDTASAVILLEDVHHNVEAQRHLSLALQALAAEPGPSPLPVALEGAVGEFRFSSFHRFPASIARAVADSFLASGDIGGPSHAGFVVRAEAGHRGLNFTGADDATDYRKNVDAYRRSAALRARVRKAVAALRRDLARRSGKEFSPRLAAFDASVERHHRGEITLGAYAGVLASQVEATPAVRRFMEAQALETRLDLARVDVERRQVLERLVGRLSPSEISRLVSNSLGYQNGTVSFGRYYDELRGLCSAHGIDLKATPAFDAYVRYVMLADGIDGDALFAGLEAMESDAYARLATTEGERRLIADIRRSRLVERLVAFGLTSAEWTIYRSDRLRDPAIDLTPFEEFYEAAERRDAAMVASLPETGPAVLVAGGFHTEGVAEQLQRAGRTVIVCAPKLTTADPASGSAYLSVFDRERTPLEHIFAGEKLFLASVPAGAMVRLADEPDATAELAHVAESLTLAHQPSARADVMRAARELGDTSDVVSVESDGPRTTIVSQTPTGEVAAVVQPAAVPAPRKPFWRRAGARVVGSEAVLLFWRWNFPQLRRRLLPFAFPLVFVGASLLAVFGFWKSRMVARSEGSRPRQYQTVRGETLPSRWKLGQAAISAVLSLAVYLGVVSPAGTSRPSDRAFDLLALSRNGRGMHVWVENVTKAMVAPGANIIELAAKLNGDLTQKAEAEGILAQSSLAAMATRGVRGGSVTVESLADDIGNGSYARELATLAGEGVSNPEEAFRRLEGALAVLARAAIAPHFADAQVVVEIDMDAAVREGGEPAVVGEIESLSSRAPGAQPRVAAYLFGRNGFERRGAVYQLIYKTVREKGIFPQVSLDFGPHTYVLVANAFLHGVRDRCSDLLASGWSKDQIRGEVVRLSRFLNSISVDEIDREPGIGVDALIDQAVAILSNDRQNLLAAAPVSGQKDALLREAHATQMSIDRLTLLRGKSGLATAKLIHQIYRHIFYGDPLPDNDIEAVYGDWFMVDIQDARATVRSIQQNYDVLPAQPFMVAAAHTSVADGSALVRSAGLAGGWADGLEPQVHAYTAPGLAEFEDFLHTDGLPFRELISQAMALTASSQSPEQRRAYAHLLAGDAIGLPQADAVTVLSEINRDVVEFLRARNALPAKIVSTTQDHSRGTASVSDIAEAVQDQTAHRMAQARREAVAAVAAQLAALAAARTTPTSNRSLQNRQGLGNFFLFIFAVAAGGLILQFTYGDPGLLRTVLIVALSPFAALSLFFSARFYRQGFDLWRGYWRSGLDYPLIPELQGLDLLPDPSGPAASVGVMLPHETPSKQFLHSIRLNPYLFDVRRNRSRLPEEVQRSIFREESRHLAYRNQHKFPPDQPRRWLSLGWEEVVVNVWMPLQERWRRQPHVPTAPIHRREAPLMDLSLRDERARLQTLSQNLRRLKAGEDVQLPEYIFISDQHGTIDVFDALLLDAITSVQPLEGVTRLDAARPWTSSELDTTITKALRDAFPGHIPTDFVLPPDVSLLSVLDEFNIDPAEARRHVRFINPMGLAHAHKFGREVAHRAQELVDLGLEFKLDPDKTLDDQLVPHGVSLEGLKGKIFFHNLGDFKDRGPYGIKVLNRSRELIEAGLSDYITGNHDLLTMMNLLGLHLPWYRGFQFHGYKDSYDAAYGNVADLVAVHHERDPDTRTRTWWAKRLSEYEAYQAKKQKELWTPSVDRVINGVWDKAEKKYVTSGLYAQIAPTLMPEHKKLWEKFKGFYLVNIQTGTRAVGLSSIKWWEELLAEFHKAYAEVRLADRFQHRPSHDAWQQAIDMMEKEIIPTLRTDLETHLQPTAEYPEGQWWWRVFEAINYKNYTSPEWYAKDWVFHTDWGPNVIAELNEIEKARLGDRAKEVTNANYFDNPVIEAAANYYKKNFTLFGRDDFQNTYMHAFLPIDMTGDGGKRQPGEFYFTYKGVEYRGKGSDEFPSVWEGMRKIEQDIRNGRSLADINEALSLVNSWYADNTTVIKPHNIVDAINTFGEEELARLNGFNRLYSGHLPFHEFSKIGTEKLGRVSGFQTGGRIIFTDHGMGVRFGSRGGYVVSSAKRGLYLRGREMKGYEGIVDHPRTLQPVAGAEGPVETVLFQNPGIDREVYLDTLIRDVDHRIEEIDQQFALAARSAANRIALAVPFIALIAATLLLGGNPVATWSGSWKLVVILLSVSQVFRMGWQWAALVRADFRATIGRDEGPLHWAVARYSTFHSASNEAAVILNGEIKLKRGVIGQLSLAQQRSVIAEEMRHLRYEKYWGIPPQTMRSDFWVFIEEFVVNFVMPVMDWIRPDPEIRRLDHDYRLDEELTSLRRQNPDFDRLLTGLSPSTEKMQEMLRDFMGQIQAGIEGRRQSLEMIPTKLRLPTGQETGYVVVVDWGGSNGKFYLWELQGNGRVRLVQELPEYPFTKADRANPRGLYPMLVDKIQELVGKLDEADRNREFPVVVAFAFPPGSVLSKGWSDPHGLPAMTSDEIRESFQKVFDERHLSNLKAKEGENDTLGPMMIENYERLGHNPHALIAAISMILGTGHNIAALINGVIWNLESGAYDSPALRSIVTPMDVATDRNSNKPGVHIFEKMVAGGNKDDGAIGEVLRNSLLQLRAATGRFAWNQPLFAEPNQMDSGFLSDVAATNGDSRALDRLLEERGVTRSTWDERHMLYALAESILDRSARLIAMALAAVIRTQDPALTGRYVIPVEGSVFEFATHYQERLKKALAELLGEDVAARIELVPNRGRKGAGTAVLTHVTRTDDPTIDIRPLEGDQREALQARPSDRLPDDVNDYPLDQVTLRSDGTKVIQFEASSRTRDGISDAVSDVARQINLSRMLQSRGFYNLETRSRVTSGNIEAPTGYGWSFHGAEIDGDISISLQHGIWIVEVRSTVNELADDLLSDIETTLLLSGMLEKGTDWGQPRSLGNRLFLAATFVAPLVIGGLAFLATGDQFAGTLWMPALVAFGGWALGALPFLWQAFWIFLATTGLSRYRGLASGIGLPYLVDTLGTWTVAFSLLGTVFVNKKSFVRLPHGQQRSAIREERRHVRYWEGRTPSTQRWYSSAWEEWYVNVVMPAVDLFRRFARTGRRVIPIDAEPSETVVIDVRTIKPDNRGRFNRGGGNNINLNADLLTGLGLTLLGTGRPFGIVVMAGAIAALIARSRKASPPVVATTALVAAGLAAVALVEPGVAAAVLGGILAAASVVRWTSSRIEAHRWVAEGRRYQAATSDIVTSSALVDALDAAAPKGLLFSGRSADDFRNAALARFATQTNASATEADRLTGWSTLAGYRRAIARDGGATLETSLARAARRGAKTRVIVYHVNQLGTESVVPSELSELQALIESASHERERGVEVAVVVAVSPGLSTDNAAAVDRLVTAGRGVAVAVGVTDDLRLNDGGAYSYEKLLRKADAGARLEALDALLQGNYDSVSFLTFSKIPAQFRADGRLRAVWTLLANIGAGWAPLPVDTMIRAAELAKESA